MSLALGVTPWLFPHSLGLSIGLIVQVAWFSAFERLVPQSAPAAVSPAGRAAPQPVAARAQAPRAAAVSAAVPKPIGFVQVPVLAVFQETPDIRTFRMARPDGFDFVAGQFLPIRVRVDGHDHVRCYSISSSPAVRGYLEISVKRQGLVSSTLHAIARPGALFSVRPPGGAFTYPGGDDRPVVLLAGGIGITPLLSMLRHAVEAEPSRSITLLYAAATEEALAFRHDIRVLLRRHPQVRAFFVATSGTAGPDLQIGHINEALLRASVGDVSHAIAMLCGPPPMIDAMRGLLSSLGMPAAQIRSELFNAAVAASTGHMPLEAPPQAAAAATTHEVTCERSKKAVRADRGQTLLDAAEAGGVGIDSLCRSGVCGTCRTRVIAGDVACDSTVLGEGDRTAGFVLACVAHPKSDCVIDA